MEIPGGRGYALQAPPGMKIPRGLGGGDGYFLELHNEKTQ